MWSFQVKEEVRGASLITGYLWDEEQNDGMHLTLLTVYFRIYSYFW